MYLGVVGAGSCDHQIALLAEEVGKEIARQGAVLVCGGLGGVMEAASRGARKAGGMAVGVLPGGDRREGNPHLTFALATGLGEARNAVVVRASDALIAVAGGYGTLAEIGLALRLGVPVVGLNTWKLSRDGVPDKSIIYVSTPQEAVAVARERALRPPRKKFFPPVQTLGLVRAQKHAFLNDLQVLLSLLQLGKDKEALAYTRRMIAALQQKGQITRLALPLLALYLGGELEEAAALGIEVGLVVEDSLELALAQEEEILTGVSFLWGKLKDFLQDLPPEARRCRFKIWANEVNFYFCWFLPSALASQVIETSRAMARELVQKYSLRESKLTVSSGDQVLVTLAFPKVPPLP